MCLGAFVWLWSNAAGALPPDLTASQLYHTQWTVQDGAPTLSENIAQTADGFIWVVGAGRLYRFDGVEFERVERVGDTRLAEEKVYSLWSVPEGGLWISYIFGGASFLHEGRLENHLAGEGLPRNSIVAFGRDGEGRTWAGTTRGLWRLQAGQWVFASPAEWGIPETVISSIALDREGTMWVIGGQSLFYLRRGSQRFEQGMSVPTREELVYFITSPEGDVWLVRARHGMERLRTSGRGRPARIRWQLQEPGVGYGILSCLIDRDGTLWLATTDGITRMPFPSKEQAAAPLMVGGTGRVRIAGEQVMHMLEDREGNVWVTSNGGIDKFRTSAFVRVPLPRGSDLHGLATAEDGSVWVASRLGALHRFDGDVEREILRAPTSHLETIHRGRDGSLWVGNGHGAVWQWRAGRWVPWHRPRAEGEPESVSVQAIATGPDGSVWMSFTRAGVYRVIGDRWERRGGRSDLPDEAATMLTFDEKGRLWLGYVGSRLAMLDGDRLELHGPGDGLRVGAVLALHARDSRAWVGGETGLSLFDGSRFHPMLTESGRSLMGVNGITETSGGDLWLNTSEGAVRVEAAEVRRFVADPRHGVRVRILDYLDGMPGAPVAIRPLPTLVEARDGRIWFTSAAGVVWLDPKRLTSNPVIPTVVVKSLNVDGRRFVLDGTSRPLELSPNPRNLQIAYTASSLTIPERVRFRYRLEGSDMGWQDVGTRREAYFTELAPGRYRFQVVASNDAGLWNEQGASIEFIVPPTFIQTPWFIALCVLAATGVMWLLFLYRMREVKAQLHWRNEARLLERERIARELHDTFLQAVHGLMLRFQTATERIPEGEPARKLMEDALDRADRVLAEGRDKVAGLRGPEGPNLYQSLKDVGAELSRDCGVAFDVHIEGVPRELNAQVRAEAHAIGTEALTNAFHHARATRIGVRLRFARRSFSLRVTDDGSGFEECAAVKPRHWGLKGMRERASRLRARLTIASRPGVGTTVELIVPARFAYRSECSRSWIDRLTGRTMEDMA